MPTMIAMLGNGVYGYSEAALLTRLNRDRVREWFRVRREKPDPVFTSDYAPVGGGRAISFLDLIDVFVAGQLHEHGVSLRTLRAVYARLRDDLKSSHPFCRSELLSDGKTVFMRGVDDKGLEELKEVLTRQKVFPQIILPFLRKIDYGEVSKMAERWRIAPMVVIDPRLCLGKPIVEAVSIPTAILAAAYQANGKDEKLVAGWYNIQPSHVLAAVEFETTLAA
jgi:uncharacterized protein (DUF433 family)